MKTVHFFAFYTHNLPKNTFFAPRSSMNLKITKSLHFDGDGWGCSALSHFFRCAISLLQMRNQFSSDAHSILFKCAIKSSSNFNFRIFEILPLLLGWLAPVFMMIYSYFYDEVAEYRLNHHGYCLEFVSAVDCNIFLPRTQNFQARKILVSSWENFMLNTRINYIPYENEVYSGKEWSVFS